MEVEKKCGSTGRSNYLWPVAVAVLAVALCVQSYLIYCMSGVRAGGEGREARASCALWPATTVPQATTQRADPLVAKKSGDASGQQAQNDSGKTLKSGAMDALKAPGSSPSKMKVDYENGILTVTVPMA